MPRSISYGPAVHDDGELRLCGDPQGRRALELGVSDAMNALALAELGAKCVSDVVGTLQFPGAVKGVTQTLKSVT